MIIDPENIQKTAAAAESKSLESNDTPVVASGDDRDEVDHVSTDLSTDEPVAPAAPLSVAFVDTSVRDYLGKGSQNPCRYVNC